MVRPILSFIACLYNSPYSITFSVCQRHYHSDSSFFPFQAIVYFIVIFLVLFFYRCRTIYYIADAPILQSCWSNSPIFFHVNLHNGNVTTQKTIRFMGRSRILTMQFALLSTYLAIDLDRRKPFIIGEPTTLVDSFSEISFNFLYSVAVKYPPL